MAYLYQLQEDEFNHIAQVNSALVAYSVALNEKEKMDYNEQAQADFLYMLSNQLNDVIRKIREEENKRMNEQVKFLKAKNKIS